MKHQPALFTSLKLFGGIMLVALLATALLATPVLAQAGRLSGAEVDIAALFQSAEESQELAVLQLPGLDLERVFRQDEARAKRGGVPHYAAALRVEADPWNLGTWQAEAGGLARWQLRIHSPGALSLSLGFKKFSLPEGAKLSLRAGDVTVGPFTHQDNEAHGQLWTPPVISDDMILQLVVPLKRLDEVELLLSRVHHGYAGFGEPPAEKSGPCHSDPACYAGGDWQRESRSVALLSVEGVRFCTGFLVNNTAQDQRPLLITARHCGVHKRNAESVVVMWNHQKASCEGADPPPASQNFQSGARLLAAHYGADISLLELDDPALPGAVFAGWDRSEDDPVEAIAIHHPNTDQKRLAVARGPARTTAHLSSVEQSAGDHLRVASWRLGTTEGGSSGAPLLNEDRRVVGVLHGGYAACGNQQADWFGRLSVAWHGPSSAHRLRDWLDPNDQQPLVLDALNTTRVRPAAVTTAKSRPSSGEITPPVVVTAESEVAPDDQ